MRDRYDIMHEGDEALSEVELTSKLIIAASEFDGAMSLESIDRILGVQRDAASSE